LQNTTTKKELERDHAYDSNLLALEDRFVLTRSLYQATIKREDQECHSKFLH
jgi:hypothetical protein